MNDAPRRFVDIEHAGAGAPGAADGEDRGIAGNAMDLRPLPLQIFARGEGIRGSLWLGALRIRVIIS